MQVKRRRGRPGKDTVKLEQDMIIQKAKELTLRNGKVPSLRFLAKDLKVDPMAIYHYFSNKQTILEAVSISLISEIYSPIPGLAWRENLMSLCRSYISLLLKYPDLISIFLSTTGTGVAAVFQNRFELCVEELNLNSEEVRTITSLIADYIHGFTFASACNQTDVTVSVDMAEGPLEFIIDNIENLYNRD